MVAGMRGMPTAVVTGATSGLGEAAALALASNGWRVFVVGRDASRGAAVVTRALARSGHAELLTGDLSTIDGVRAVSHAVCARTASLNLLINNAGGTFARKELTCDGVERTFALNVLAPYLLTEALLPELAVAKGRVVNVVTGIPRGAQATLAQLVGEQCSAGIGGYMRCKLALAALTQEQQRRYASRGVTAVSLHPGIIPGTRFGQDTPQLVRAMAGAFARALGVSSTLDEAVSRYLTVATRPVERGGFYAEGRIDPGPNLARDPVFGSEIWGALEALSRSPAA
jgi:NAD(P)-dependent dehydrogenase (short-subunit alcohol dehydrogenase family)